MRNTLGMIRYAFRQFVQAPIFTATAILTLALGIGGLVTAAGALVLFSLLAAIIPATRAALISPMSALRSE